MNTVPIIGVMESSRGCERELSGSHKNVGVVGELEMTVGGVGEVQLLAACPVPPATQRPPQSVAEADGHDGVQQRVDS